MSESTTENAAQPEAPKPTQPPAGPRPPWGSDAEFNAEKAWSLLQNVRADLSDTKAALEAARKDAASIEEFKVKAQEAEDTAQETALSLHRERAARTHGLTDEQVEFLAELTDPEGIEARAAKLAAMTAAPSRPVDPTQGSTAKDAGQASNADLFAQAVDGAFTR